MMLDGTSSTQVWPGWSGMTCPAAFTNCVGEASVERCQVAAKASPLR